MRVLILTQYYSPEIGAPQTRLAAFARELVRRGHEVEVVTAMPHHLQGRTYVGYRRKFYMRDEIDGTIVHRTWVYAATGTGLRRIANYLSFTVTSLVGLALAKRPDVVFVESPPLFLSIPGWIAALRYRAKLIFNVADLWPDSVRDLGVMPDGIMIRLAESLEAWTYRRADIVNAVTNGIDRVLRDDKRVPDRKLRFLPNGIDIDTFAPRAPVERLRRTLDIDDRRVFIYAGTHGIAQALQHVVDAAKLVDDRAIVLFVGAGPTKRSLIERARRDGVKNVRFVDAVPLDVMPDYFSLAYGAIVPLVSTGLMRGARPSKLFPALASGVPIVYSGEGEGARLVSDARAGVVVAPEQPALVAEAMRWLCDHPAEQAAMAVAARQLAVDRFAWSSIVGSWLTSLEPAGAIPI
ncbi:MAG: glycosyltransferase family 4 protein [Candidatus Eremiobacteraeota bacterium]|nr:glycosyltransferase family 4 protein [Candidatus Eremiobacteraeota bacterium]